MESSKRCSYENLSVFINAVNALNHASHDQENKIQTLNPIDYVKTSEGALWLASQINYPNGLMAFIYGIQNDQHAIDLLSLAMSANNSASSQLTSLIDHFNINAFLSFSGNPDKKKICAFILNHSSALAVHFSQEKPQQKNYKDVNSNDNDGNFPFQNLNDFINELNTANFSGSVDENIDPIMYVMTPAGAHWLASHINHPQGILTFINDVKDTQHTINILSILLEEKNEACEQLVDLIEHFDFAAFMQIKHELKKNDICDFILAHSQSLTNQLFTEEEQQGEKNPEEELSTKLSQLNLNVTLLPSDEYHEVILQSIGHIMMQILSQPRADIELHSSEKEYFLIFAKMNEFLAKLPSSPLLPELGKMVIDALNGTTPVPSASFINAFKIILSQFQVNYDQQITLSSYYAKRLNGSEGLYKKGVNQEDQKIANLIVSLITQLTQPSKKLEIAKIIYAMLNQPLTSELLKQSPGAIFTSAILLLNSKNSELKKTGEQKKLF